MKHPSTSPTSTIPKDRISIRLCGALILAITAFALAFGNPAAFAAANNNQAADEKEFLELSESRKERKMLLDFLIRKGLAKEVANGTIQPLEGADEEAKKTIAAENKTRRRMFELIAEQQKKTPQLVGKEFHQKLAQIAKKNGKTDKPTSSSTMLTLRGSAVVGKGLAPDLASAFLKEKGYRDIKIEEGKTTHKITVTGEHPKAGDIAKIEIVSGDSSSGLGADGLAGQKCDIAMTSRTINTEEVERLVLEGLGDPRNENQEIPIALDGLTIIVHPENKTDAISVKQLARAFSGHYLQWASLNGGYCDLGLIDIYARSEETGKWASFKELVLDPNRKALRADVQQRYVDGDDVVAGVLGNTRGVGFVGIENINPKLKILKIKAHDRAPAVLPTAANLQNGNYSLSHPLYFYLSKKATPIAREFTEFTIGKKGQTVVANTRLASLEPVTRTLEIVADAATNDEPQNMIAENTTPAPTAPVAKRPAIRAVPIPVVEEKAKPEIKAAESAPQIGSQQKSDAPVTSREQQSAYNALIKGADRKLTAMDLQFTDSYKANLKPASRAEFERIVELLKQPENASAKVILIGFSDSRGRLSTNQKLSEMRAKGVAKMFQRAGIENVEIGAFGEAMPVTSNIYQDGRDQNRRVEIWLAR